MKLAVAIETPEQGAWIAPVELGGGGISVVPFVLAGQDDGARIPEGRRIARPLRAASPLVGNLPDFGELVAALSEETVDACLLLADSPATRLLALAADLLGVSNFRLLTTAGQLRDLGDRDKPRPDLFFLANQALFPAALEDWRYGSTLLPTGQPDGDAEAARRLRQAIERWRDRQLDPAQPELSVIVPAFREAANLPLVCDRLLAALDGRVASFEILLVDDASPDDTYHVALDQMWRSPRIRALTKAPPRGMGNAIRHGLARARAPYVAITMGDGSDEVERIPEMLAQVRDEGFALAIGSRYRHRRNYATVPRLYRFWSACFRWCTRLLVGLRLSDYTNSFRVFDRKIFARYGPESGGFEISPETTFKAWLATGKVTEVDVRHLKRAAGQSSFSFLRAGPGYGKMLIKALVARLTGRWFTLDW